MTLIRVLLILAVTSLVAPGQAVADYLEVRRSANIKERPQRSAITIQKPEIGAYLALIDEGRQVNGYYRIRVSNSDRQGWIYRTLVRRYRGHPPGALGSGDTGLGSDDAAILDGSVMRAHFIDVDQGDAALLEFSCGVILIDAGGTNDASTTRLIRYLTRFFERRPDLNDTINTIFITHTHKDHNKSLKDVVRSFNVENYVHNGELTGSGKSNAKWMVKPGNAEAASINMRTIGQTEINALSSRTGFTDGVIDSVNCQGGVDPDIRILAGAYEENPGWPDGAFNNGNNKSLVIRVEYGEAVFLFTGDLEEHAIEELVAYYEGTELLDVDVYQVGHHGSYNGTTQSLMESMTPDIAILSMSKSSFREPWTAWQFGHPRQSLVRTLDQWIDRSRPAPKWVQVASAVKRFESYHMSDSIYGTGWDGNIVVAADDQGNFVVQTSGGN